MHRLVLIGVLGASAALGGCKPERLPGERTVEELLAASAERGATDSTMLSVDMPLAQVGDRTITIADFERALGSLSDVARFMYDVEQRRPYLLELLLRVEVMAQDAAANGLSGGVDERLRVDEARLRLWIDEVIEGRRSLADVSTEQVEAAFAARPHLYSFPERRSADLILVATREEADYLLARMERDVEAGVETRMQVFERYVRSHSLHEHTRAEDGATGNTASTDAGARGNPAVLEALFGAEERELLGPIEVAEGFVLLLVTNIIEAAPWTAADLEFQLRPQLFRESVARDARERLDALRAELGVQIDEAQLAAIDAARLVPAPTEPVSPRRFDVASLADLPSRYVDPATLDELAAAPEWLNNPSFDFGLAPQTAATAEGSGVIETP